MFPAPYTKGSCKQSLDLVSTAGYRAVAKKNRRTRPIIRGHGCDIVTFVRTLQEGLA